MLNGIFRKMILSLVTTTVTVCLIAIVILVLLHLWKINTRLYKAIEQQFEGPKPLPFIGNVLDFNIDPVDRYKKIFNELFEQYKDKRFLRYWFGPDPYVIIQHPKDIEAVLTSSFGINKAPVYDVLKPWVRDGLFLSKDNKWRQRRKFITNAFHFNILENFIESFDRNTDILVKELKSKVGEGIFDIHEITKIYSLYNIYETAMGLKMEDFEDVPIREYIAATDSVLNIGVKRSYMPWLKPDILFKLHPLSRELAKALEISNNTTIKTIEKKKKIFKKNESGITLVDDIGQKRKPTFLDLLMEHKESDSLTDNDLFEETTTFIFGGHDTSAVTLSFACYALSKNLEVQEELFNEVCAYLDDNDDDMKFTQKNLADFQYLDRFIKESLRCYNTVPILGRNITNDLPLSDGYYLPKGCNVFILPEFVHMNPDYYPNPTKFNPDNFLPEACASRPAFAYIPFCAGPRNCIGQKYAVLSLKIALIKIVKNFKFLPCENKDNVRLVLEGSLKSVNGVNLAVQHRNKLHCET